MNCFKRGMRDIRIPLLLLTKYAICVKINGDQDSAASGEEVTLSGLVLSTADGFATGVLYKNAVKSFFADIGFELIGYFVGSANKYII